MEGLISASLSPQRFNVLLLGAFAGLALVLAAVGIYSVLAYSVRRRLREIGIRMHSAPLLRCPADGSCRWHEAYPAGRDPRLAAAFALSRVVSSLIYGVRATDPLTFASVALLLMPSVSSPPSSPPTAPPASSPSSPSARSSRFAAATASTTRIAFPFPAIGGELQSRMDLWTARPARRTVCAGYIDADCNAGCAAGEVGGSRASASGGNNCVTTAGREADDGPGAAADVHSSGKCTHGSG